MQSLLKKRWDCIIIRLNVLRESHYDANSLIRLRMWCLFDNRVTTTLLLDPVFEIQGYAFSRIKDTIQTNRLSHKCPFLPVAVPIQTFQKHPGWQACPLRVSWGLLTPGKLKGMLLFFSTTGWAESAYSFPWKAWHSWDNRHFALVIRSSMIWMLSDSVPKWKILANNIILFYVWPSGSNRLRKIQISCKLKRQVFI